MCGIIAYKGAGAVVTTLVEGLSRLEYRGYDSAGIGYVTDDGKIQIHKVEGTVSALRRAVERARHAPCHGVGIGHTRWATHGAPNQKNAHPHLSHGGRVAIVHNGIVENYHTLAKRLSGRGYAFNSDTDTEVLASLIEHHYQDNLEEAVRLALNEVMGAYAIVAIASTEPGKLVMARRGSPLIIGVGEAKTFFVSSDATSLVAHTRNVVHLQDEEIAIITGDALRIQGDNNQEVVRNVERIDASTEVVEKDGYAHFMLKEICTQPNAVAECMRGRVRDNQVHLGGIRDYEHSFRNARRIIIVGCGTSWHAALLGEYIIEGLCALPVEVEYASEFRYRNPVIRRGDVVIAISQSGETADTLAAVDLSKKRGATVIGVVNVVGSSIARLTDGGIYLHAGPEIGVASTKAFTTQLTVLIMLALWIREKRGVVAQPDELYHQLVGDLTNLPHRIKNSLQRQTKLQAIAAAFQDCKNFLYLGRGYNFPVALEGALKLKEIAYVHAEGYPAAEMKHGPIALIDQDMPVVVVATRDSSYQKIISNIQEVKARKAKVIAVISQEDPSIEALADCVIKVPKSHEVIMPILTVLPLQLLAYHIAVLRGCDVDKPRNLAKSVTVE